MQKSGFVSHVYMGQTKLRELDFNEGEGRRNESDQSVRLGAQLAADS